MLVPPFLALFGRSRERSGCPLTLFSEESLIRNPKSQSWRMDVWFRDWKEEVSDAESQKAHFSQRTRGVGHPALRRTGPRSRSKFSTDPRAGRITSPAKGAARGAQAYWVTVSVAVAIMGVPG